jgi:hypothetical protein
MNYALQARIHKLESTLAQLLHEKDRDPDEQVNSMIDLKMCISSPSGSDHVVTKFELYSYHNAKC